MRVAYCILFDKVFRWIIGEGRENSISKTVITMLVVSNKITETTTRL